MTEFQHLQNITADWSDSVFGKRTNPIGSLRHLKEEVDEIIQEPNDLIEYCDAFLLLIDSARMSGFTMEQLYEGCIEKLEINKNRKWKYDPETDLIKHVKELIMEDEKIGTVVQLKSGGPLMTVIKVNIDSKTITCAWFYNALKNECILPFDSVHKPSISTSEYRNKLKDSM